MITYMCNSWTILFYEIKINNKIYIIVYNTDIVQRYVIYRNLTAKYSQMRNRNHTASRFSERTDQMTMLAMILSGVAVTYGKEIGMIDKMDIA